MRPQLRVLTVPTHRRRRSLFTELREAGLVRELLLDTLVLLAVAALLYEAIVLLAPEAGS